VVTAVLVHHDSGLYDLTVDDHGRAVLIATTSSHLFWVPAPAGHSGWWVKAAALRYSDRLRTPDGSAAIVTGGWAPKTTSAWMWDLTVPGSNDHDFYVLAGSTAVLVHNCADGPTVSLYKAPAKGMTAKIMQSGWDPADFPGTPGDMYSDGSAYFGIGDRGLQIAQDYASRANWDSNVLEVRIPKADFDQYFSDYVASYDGIPGAQAIIPNTAFDQLNQYPPSIVGQ
jgi:hypothetical protein